MKSLLRGIATCGAALMLTLSTAAAQGGSIAGKVTIRGTGAPVEGARVQAINNVVVVGQATTGADGAYTIANLPDARYTVAARMIGLEFTTLLDVQVSGGGRATADLATSPLVAMIDRMTSSADRGAQAEKILESPNSIAVVPAVLIAERAAATVTDHVKALPGLSISTGGIGQANIVSRGFNNAFSGSMLMLQDYRFAGVPSLRVNVPFLFTGSNEDIDRIEVLQGPAAALYGPNSSGGVLHVITKSPFESMGTTLTVAGGQQSFMRASGRHAGADKAGRFGYKLSGEYFSASDFKYVDPNEPATYPTSAALPASRRGAAVAPNYDLNRMTGEARFDYRPGVHTELITTVGASQLGDGREITTAFGAIQSKNWRYMNFQERFRHKGFFAQVFFDQSNSGNKDSTDDAGSYYRRSGLSVVDRSTVLVGQVQQRVEYRDMRFVFGGEYNATRPQTEGTINGRNEDDDNINEYGAYVQATRPLTSKLDLLASARGDVNSRLEGTQFSPRAALVWKAHRDHNVRVTFARTFNSPASFSFALDQYYRPGAPSMDVRVMGNPTKVGWHFDRSCTGGAYNGMCMRSPYLGHALTPASAASTFRNFTGALPTIIAGLPVSSFPNGEADRAGLLALLSPQLRGYIATLTPTDGDIGTVLVDLSQPTPTPTAAPSDINPLSALFTNTWELGYKGRIGKRASVAIDYWTQRRPADPTIGVSNPGVVFNPTQLNTYMHTRMDAVVAGGLQAQGMPAAQAQATAVAAVNGLVGLMGKIPVGATAFDSPLYDKSYLVLTYRPAIGFVNVHGIDIAGDVTLAPDWTLSSTYSWLSENIFPDAPGASASNPYAANTPKHRATATVRYANEGRGLSAEVRGRYADAFQVNSGLLNSYNQQTPVPYPGVPVNALLDINASYALPQMKGMRVSLTGNNILDNQVQTFVGVPKMGRLIVTQLQYSW